MSTVPETTSTIQFDEALRSLAAQATERYAGEKARIDRGLCLALNGHVTIHPDGTASVQSGSDAEVVYHVAHGTCDCPDFTRAPDGRCKHRYAVCLVKKAMAQLAQAQAQVREQAVTQDIETIDRLMDLCANVLEDIEAAKALLARGTPEPEPTPAPISYYATYDGPAGSWHAGQAQGVVRHIDGSGWFFTTLEGDTFYAETEDLTLGGRVDILEAQREADGSLVAKVCNHHGARRI